MGKDYLVLSDGHFSSYSQKDGAVISALYMLEISKEYKINWLKTRQKPQNDRSLFFFFFLAFAAVSLIKKRENNKKTKRKPKETKENKKKETTNQPTNQKNPQNQTK